MVKCRGRGNTGHLRIRDVRVEKETSTGQGEKKKEGTTRQERERGGR
jgi:hypothetical protein